MGLSATGNILEVGTWCGKSALALGLAARERGTKVFCVDLWPEEKDWFKTESGYKFMVEGDTSFDECAIYTETFENYFLPVYRKGGPYRVFRENVVRFDLEDVVYPIRGTTKDIPKDLYAGLAYIDADHSEDAVKQDIERVRKHVHGWMIFDDANGRWPGVLNAVNDLKVFGSQITERLYAARC